jgi:xanthine dehydrogenase iron-sulfur cluster and FAD-binding subunit A
MWREYFNVTSIDQALSILSERGERARVVAGATDLILEMERGVRSGIDTLIDITRIPDIDNILIDENGIIHLGPLVTHNHCVASKLIHEKAFPLAQAAWEVGSPQIRNRGTIAGNLITASPANDTITPLMALGAMVNLRSTTRERIVPLRKFYQGVRQTVMQPDEMLVEISFPAMQADQSGAFIKLALRRAQAISLVNVALILTFSDHKENQHGKIKVENAAITLGAVAPTIINAPEAENYLVGKVLDDETIEKTARMVENSAKPIDDVRASHDYRREMVRVCTLRGLRNLARSETIKEFPSRPVLLRGEINNGYIPILKRSTRHTENHSSIKTWINGVEYTFNNGYQKSLLRLLREDARLTGTKEGCSEGECGACTVFLDGMAVMSCMVPAARAHGAKIVTIEGMAHNGELHPVQKAFIEEGAVQCGYCTPGFIMSAAKLLEENPHPSIEEIQYSLTGNLCRCTGYYKIISAIEKASRMEIEYE